MAVGRAAASVGGLLGEAGNGWLAHKASKNAAAIAFYGIFSLAPLLVILVTIAGYWFGRDAVEGLIVERASDLLGAKYAGFIESVVAQAYTGRGSIPAIILSVLLLMFGASRVVGATRDALDEIWDVPPRAKGRVRGYVITKLVDLLLVLVVGFMFLATMLANAIVSALVSRFTEYVPVPGSLLRLGTVVFSLLVVMFFVAVIFRVFPNAHTPWRHILVGAGTTAVLFAIANYAVGLYLGQAGINSVFGAAGSLAAVMLWMYYSAQTVLFGAELTKTHQMRSTRARQNSTSPASSTQESTHP
ncbi:MAG: YihY/virulence factor BrkB family protein [Thermoleophilia bacterium]|nr:YihY/virulence factor BrkB family protein [Thermoleophilia bacterium]